MTRKVLFIDDDESILETFERVLGFDYEVETASSGPDGLKVLQEEGPFAVVVSDLRMPEMDGVETLARIKELSPNTVRVMLTGHADLEASIAAVNEGRVFRFLTKPCPPPTLKSVLDASLEQYRLVTAEKELLRHTLRGAIKVLTDTLAILKPDVYGRTSRLLPYIRQLSQRLDDPQPWRTETAAMLASLGFITLPDSLLSKLDRGVSLNREEREIYRQHVDVAERLLTNLPRMEEVSAIIRYQDKHFDGSGQPEDMVEGHDIPLGSRILKAVKDFDDLLVHGVTKPDALKALRLRRGVYDPQVLDMLAAALGDEARYVIKTLTPGELQPGMVLAQDVFTEREAGKVKVAGKGQELSDTTIAYLRRYAMVGRIEKPIKVIVNKE
jgi:response regulator RpfG family c-di-GMP phosphodiesterase